MSEPTHSPFSRYQLAELAAPGSDTFVDGPFGSSLKSHEYVDAGVRLIQLQNIGEGEWRDENKKFITPRKLKTLERHGAVPGDIAIAKMADPVARACLVPPVSEQFVVVADCIRLRLDESRFDAGYVVRSINSPYTRREAENKAIGSTRVRINLSVLKTVGCLAPALPEQQEITHILDTLDTAIHETEAIIAKLKAVKQGLLHDLLTRGIAANGELRPPQAEAPHLYKASPLGWIPNEWDATDLGALTTWASGGTPNRAIASNWIGDVPLLTPKDMKAFELSDTSEHINLGAAQSGARLMPPETVFIVVRGMILAHSFPVVVATRAMAFNQDIKAVSPGPRMDGRFLAHWFVANSDRFLRKVTEATHGTKKLDMENLVGMSIGLPPLAEQDGIVARQKAVDDQLEDEASSLSKLQTLKAGLMDDLLTGRVRVTPLLEAAAP